MKQEIIAQATKSQQDASNPKHSVWVSASAGSGKTTVLTNRVLRLLLAGTNPATILCLTFTKAAAAEMKNRINKELCNWVSLTDDELIAKLERLTGSVPNSKTLSFARKLFALTLDNADGLRILTIHSFCQTIMKKFPVEAGIIPNFRVVEGREVDELIMEARRKLLSQEIHISPEIREAVKNIVLQLNDESFTDILAELLQKRGHLVYLFNRHFGVNGVIEEVYKKLGCTRGMNKEELWDELLNDVATDIRGLRQTAEVMENGSDAEKKVAIKIKKWLENKNKNRDDFPEYKSVFVKVDGDAKKISSIINKDSLQSFPAAEQILLREQERILNFLDKKAALTTAILTESLLLVGNEILRIYSELKVRSGLMDFNDLIIGTSELLQNSSSADWVKYKLDSNIRHILIDEGQDTSQHQWLIINAICEDFFSGQGQVEDDDRTIFVVGDEKQSIFSFQGADPQIFYDSYGDYESKSKYVQKDLKRIGLASSFRSLDGILEFVDCIFSGEKERKAISNFEEKIQHQAARDSLESRIEVWPVINSDVEKDKKDKDDFSWKFDFSTEVDKNAREKLANTIAKTIRKWVNEGRELPAQNGGKGRKICYGDIMILLRNRSKDFNHILIRALNREGVPVAGVDRMNLTKEIVIEDLVSLAKFILFPYDELNLACLLKSPLIGFSEDDLFNLSVNRSDKNLWQSLCDRKEEFPFAYDYLTDMINRAELTTPLELFSYVLNIKDGQKKIFSRFGTQSVDLLDQFLNLCLEYEQNNSGSLQDFVRYLTASDIEIKRDMDGEADEVRIMTVHSAKGLQAPIVFLPDTMSDPLGNLSSKEKILWEEGIDGLPFWTAVKDNRSKMVDEVVNRIKEAILREHLRLLYVALTRAEDELYIAGYNDGKTEDKILANSWYSVIKERVSQDNNLKKYILSDEEFTEKYLNDEAKGSGFASSGEEQERLVLPDFVNTPPSLEVYPHTINPSEYYRSKRRNESPVLVTKAAVKGKVIHKLLELLPTVEAAKRKEVAYIYTEVFNRSLEKDNRLTEPEKEEMVRQTLTILDSAEFAEFFGENSRAEVPVAGKFKLDARNVIVSGQIDRLVIKDEEIIIIDYKTASHVPSDSSGIPEEYIKQTELYKSIISTIYPNKRIKCAILWTVTPELMFINNII